MKKLIGAIAIDVGTIYFLLVIGYAAILEDYLPAEEWGTIFGIFLLSAVLLLILGAFLNPPRKEERRCGRCHQPIPESIFVIGCPTCDR